MKQYGPYYYFNNFIGSFRLGAWTSSRQKRKTFGKINTDNNGKYLQGGIIRFAIFLGKSKSILYKKNSFKEEYNINIVKDNDTYRFLDEKELSKNKGKWANKYDSLVIGRIKFENLSGYFNYNTQYIVKDYVQFTSLSVHQIDNNTLKPLWDPTYKLYNIK